MQKRTKDYFDYNILYKETSMMMEQETALNPFFERVCTSKEVSTYIYFFDMQTEKNNVSISSTYRDDTNLKELKQRLSKIDNILEALFSLTDLSGIVKNQNFLLHHFINERNDEAEDFTPNFINDTHFTSNHVINCLSELYEQYKNVQS